MPHSRPLSIGAGPLRLEQVVEAARGSGPVHLAAGVRERMQKSVQLLEHWLSNGVEVYGVTTGFGESVEHSVLPQDWAALATNLVRFHGCGTGALFSPREARAITIARLASLAIGYSAVRFDVVARLAKLLSHGVVAAIPSEGSVGASGDLTPLSYIAALLLGEREALVNGMLQPSAAALQALQLLPLELSPRESLALMNGTSAMTGLACLAFERAQRLCRWACALTAACSDVTWGHPEHFHPRLFELKPHPGQRVAARWIRDDVDLTRTLRGSSLQDRYSLRCAPHVIGTLLDVLAASRPVIETELNSVNDNPIIDAEHALLLHGGNFYGGHICQVMDTLKTSVANIADLLDRQLVLICQPETSHGLPKNLVPSGLSTAHHGFKAMQISTSALASEAAKLSMPASVFSRSTENHNQDKVSLGTIAARDCQRILTLAEQVATILTLALAQAVDLRTTQTPDATTGSGIGLGAQRLHDAVRATIPMLEADRRMDVEISHVLAVYDANQFPIGNVDFDDR